MLTTSLLSLLLAGAPPDAARAQALAKQKKWEALYLDFAAVAPDGFDGPGKQQVGKALTSGCEALKVKDAVMAFSLGEKAVAFDATSSGLLCAAEAAVRTDQRTEAEALFKKGASAFPDDPRFPLELGRMALGEQDADGAITALSQVPAKSKQGKQAAPLLKKARALKAQRDAALGEAQRQSAKYAEPARGASPRAPGELPAARPGSLTFESGVDSEGRQVSWNSRFRFRYFSNDRDFAQRADYEIRIREALNDCHEWSQRVLGTARQSPVDVVLYTPEEFIKRFGSGLAQSVAGLYSGSEIHMNHAVAIDKATKATLVHEYVHAVIDELTGFQSESVPAWLNEGLSEFVSWRSEGLDGPPQHLKRGMRQVALAGRLPGLNQLRKGPLIGESAAVNYAMAGMSATVLVKRQGVEQVVQLIRDTAATRDFDKTFERQYGRTLEALEAEVVSNIKSR